MTLSPSILATCRLYFGSNVRGRHVHNRCDQCPIRQPCVEFGRAPARTMEELQAARDAFARDAEGCR